MDFHANLRARYNQFVRDSCEERNCNLSLEGLHPLKLTILHVDNEQFRKQFSLEGQPLCDYLLFYDRRSLAVVVCELRSGWADLHRAYEQITNGTKVAEEILASQNVGTFLPLLLCRRISSIETKEIRRFKVFFRKKPSKIIPERCGSSLKQILEQNSMIKQRMRKRTKL